MPLAPFVLLLAHHLVSAAEVPKALVLELQVAGDLPFTDGDLASGTKDETIFRNGAADGRFGCNTPVSHSQTAGLAIEGKSVSVRQLLLSRVSEAGSVFSLEAWLGSSKELEPLSVTDMNITATTMDVSEEHLAHGQPIVSTWLSPFAPSGQLLEVWDGPSTPLTLQYDCQRAGRARIELRMRVARAAGTIDTYADWYYDEMDEPPRRLIPTVSPRLAGSEEICLAWVKECAMGWADFTMKEKVDGSTNTRVVFENGEVAQDWSAPMLEQGTYQSSTQFMLSSHGALLLEQPTIVSNQDFLEVEARSQSWFEDSFAVDRDPTPLSVLYTCKHDGHAEVTMTLFKAAVGSRSRSVGERIQIRWKKYCGEMVYKNLLVSVSSKTWKNKTMAVQGGIALEGFRRPCTKRKDGTEVANCSPKRPMLTVPAKDKTTTLEVAVDVFAAELPTFQPAPDLSFDRKMMKVTIMAPRLRKPGEKKRSWNFVVKYVCFRNGVSTVLVTLHVLGHKRIDIALRKRCVEPHRHATRSVTASQAIVLMVTICGIIGCCVLACCCRGRKEDDGFGSKVAAEAAEEEEQNMVAGGAPPAKKVGAVQDDGVTYHY